MEQSLDIPRQLAAQLSTAALSVTLLAPPLAAAQRNLLHNGSFDADSSRWGTFNGHNDPTAIAGWAAAGVGLPTGSLMIFNHSDAARSAVQCVPVTPNGSYDLRVDVLALTASTEATVGVTWYPDPGCLGSRISGLDAVHVDGPTDWSTHQAELDAPASAHSARVDLIAVDTGFGGPGGFAAAYYDNVRFGPHGVNAYDCEPTDSELCIDDQLGDRRFLAFITYNTAQGGGQNGGASAIQLASKEVDRGGLFWIFGPDNPEVLLKVLNGCAINGHFWVFYSAGTDVGLHVFVDDLATGTAWTSQNPDGTPAPPVADTEAFPCAP